ncbi:MAG TPA: 50S ribosomal protein L11 methyltransferase, partial [Vicinamibacterales bacterium]|nr:50S ribosomal protein L11 methyltransferase [Vicinamibacterales bacterium]
MADRPAVRVRFRADASAADRDLAVALLAEAETPAIHEVSGREWLAVFATARARDRGLRRLACGLRGRVTGRAEAVPDDDWARRSQSALTAVRVGQLVIAPPWATEAAGDDRDRVIVIAPSTGFGTGHHASTRLCLQALQALPLAGRRVLDIGTGSGVLALAAARLGARAVTALDLDPDALAAARHNARLNGLAGRVRFRLGDLATT